MIQTEEIRVQGMVCDACVGHVTRALKSLNGVKAAQVNLAEGKAVVTYDPEMVQVAQMEEAILEEGYQVLR